MQTNINISDELLTRYLSGKVTDDERRRVEDYLAASDEHLDEMLTVTAAIEQFGGERHKRHTRPLWPVISTAASVALIIGIGVALLHKGQSGTTMAIEPSHSYAAQDSIEAEYDDVEIMWEDSL